MPPPPLPTPAHVPAAVRLAATRLQMQQVLNAPPEPTWVTQAEQLIGPAVQRHPLGWLAGALVAGGLLTTLWRHLPPAWLGALKRGVSTLGQEAVLAWVLARMQAHREAHAKAEAQPPPQPPAQS